jgi:hypothetical protein
MTGVENKHKRAASTAPSSVGSTRLNGTAELNEVIATWHREVLREQPKALECARAHWQQRLVLGKAERPDRLGLSRDRDVSRRMRSPAQPQATRAGHELLVQPRADLVTTAQEHRELLDRQAVETQAGLGSQPNSQQSFDRHLHAAQQAGAVV